MKKLSLVLALVMLCAQSLVFAQQRNFLKEGNTLLAQDEEAVLGALNIWITGYEKNKQEGEPTFDLSLEIVQTIASRQIARLYNKAHNIYFESIKSASVTAPNNSAFSTHVQQLLPLLRGKEKKEWEDDLANNPSVLKEKIVAFWKERDPVVSTLLNERLIEHFDRVNYAQMFFNEDTTTVYKTDIRGQVYVRLGEPDARYAIDDSYRRIQAPDGFNFLYLNSAVEVDLELWIYGESGTDNIIIFGHKYGFGELSILESLLDGIDYDDKYLVDQYGQKLNITSSRPGRGLSLYGLLESLQVYHTRFDELYHNFNSQMLRGVDKTEGDIGSYNDLLGKFGTKFNFNQRATLNRQLQSIDSEKSALLSLVEQVQIQHKVFRFFDENTNPEYALVVQPDVPKEVADSLNYPLLYASTLIGGDQQGVSQFQLVDSSYIGIEEQAPMQLYNLQKNSNASDVTFVSEFFANALAKSSKLPVYFPQDLLASSGKQNIPLPDPINPKEGMYLSDIMLGKSQEINDQNRFPFVPSLNESFSNEEDLLLYYEGYNIPSGGYEIEYTISKYTFLGTKRALKDRQGITIVESEVLGTQKKYLFINLSDLESGKFEFEMSFKPNETDQDPIKRSFIFNIAE